jgi:hypothetical protein
VQHAHRFTDLKGLATQGDRTPRLHEVFVDVGLRRARCTPCRTPRRPAARGGAVRASLEELLASAEPVVLAITGAPGTGETTLPVYTAVRLAQQRHRSRRVPRTLPVLVFLRRHAAAVIADPEVTLADRISSTLGAVRSDAVPDPLEGPALALGPAPSCCSALGLDASLNGTAALSRSLWALPCLTTP